MGSPIEFCWMVRMVDGGVPMPTQLPDEITIPCELCSCALMDIPARSRQRS